IDLFTVPVPSLGIASRRLGVERDGRQNNGYNGKYFFHMNFFRLVNDQLTQRYIIVVSWERLVAGYQRFFEYQGNSGFSKSRGSALIACRKASRSSFSCLVSPRGFSNSSFRATGFPSL